MESKETISDKLTQEIVKRALEKIRSDPAYAVPGCHYELAGEGRHQAVVDFIRDQFIPDEPLAMSIRHIYPWTEEIETLWMLVVKQTLSLALISDTDDKIVAVRVSYIAKKDNLIVDLQTVKSEGLHKILGLLGQLDSLCNIYDHYKVEESFSFIALGVHKDYRRKGIGLKIQSAAVALVANFGLGKILIKGEGTSNFSKKIYEKLEFDILAEVLYEDYKENGEVVFKNMGEHKSVKLYGKLVG